MRSMTGFGEAYLEKNGSYVEVTISSLNRRYSNIKVSLEEYPAIERKIIGLVKKRISRGSVEINIKSNLLGREEEPVINQKLMKKYLKTVDDCFSDDARVDKKISAGEMLGLPGVLEVKKVARPSEDLEDILINGVKRALDELIKMRENEGHELKKDLAKRKNNINELLNKIEKQVPKALEKYRQGILKSVEAYLELPEEELSNRLADELKVYADKCDISEEVARIKSHIKQFESYLDKTGAVGKSIEFLLQELQREINTIGAKANDALISQVAVDVKSELEKCREQVKNVE